MKKKKVPSDIPFYSFMWCAGIMYFALIVALLYADASYTSFSEIKNALADKSIRSSVWLTFQTCWITAILSVLFAVPTAYILTRYNFPFKRFFDSILDIPIVLPPLVIGLSLLILFNQIQIFDQTIETHFKNFFSSLNAILPDRFPIQFPDGVTYKVPAIILAQFTVSCAFAVRTMRNTFENIDARQEEVALTMGCNRSKAFWTVVIPQARFGIMTAAILSWARALGEFGPILVFAGATRGKTEVLSTTVFLEISIGNLEGAVAVSFLMISAAVLVLVIVRMLSSNNSSW
ncbi:MAG: ABC transporter permease [Verrucomicrobiales bacterium]